MNLLLKLRNLFLLLCLMLFTRSMYAQFERIKDTIVQVYGVVMTADSLYLLPNVNIEVVGSNRGTISNEQGVYSIVMYKGDTLKFSHVGYTPKYIIIPKNIKGNMISAVQMLSNDTITYPVALIHARPTKEQFERDFINFKDVNSLMIARAMENIHSLDYALLLSYKHASDGSNSFNRQIQLNTQQQSNISPGADLLHILNPSQWKALIQSWKGNKKNK